MVIRSWGRVPVSLCEGVPVHLYQGWSKQVLVSQGTRVSLSGLVIGYEGQGHRVLGGGVEVQSVCVGHGQRQGLES